MPKKRDDGGRKEALKLLAQKMVGLRESLKTVKSECLQRARKILQDPRRKLISFSGESFKVGDAGAKKSYTGLTKVLPKLFWPETVEDPRQRSKEEVKRRKSTKHYTPSGSSQTKRRCKGHGAKHGSTVHAEVCKFVRKLAGGKGIRTVSDKYDPCTVRIINLLAENKYFPIASEHSIYDEISCVATAFDMIGIHIPTSQLVGFEVKTGGEGEVYGPHPTDGKMLYPANKIINCPQNRHAMQLLGTLLIARDRHRYQIDDAKVIRTCPVQQNAQLLAMPDWTSDPTMQENVLKSLRGRKT